MNTAKIAQNTPPAIKYLADSDRIFLTHHIEILDGTSEYILKMIDALIVSLELIFSKY